MSKDPEIITVPSLSAYFYDRLSEVNRTISAPISHEVIVYSSEVLNKYALSHQYYEKSEEGRVREKILGTKLLSAQMISRDEQKEVFKDVGDTALFLCGYFSESVNKKLVDTQYYTSIGKTAYSHLNGVLPNFLDVPRFYQVLADYFESLVTIISMVASKDRHGHDKHLLFEKILKDGASDEDYLLSNISNQKSPKAS